MPSAVPSLFSTSALQASAPAAKPSSPQASEGSSDFQSMLGQAKPRTQKTQTNGDDATAKSQQADKPKQKPHVSRKGKAQAVQKKASGDEAAEEDQSIDGDAKEVSAAQTAAVPQAPIDPSAPKAVPNPRKTTDAKSTDSSTTADESQQILAAQSTLKVQPVDQKKQQDQPQGQQQPMDTAVQAVAPDDSDDAQTASASEMTNPSPTPAKKQIAASPTKAAAEPAKQQVAIQPGKGSGNQDASAQPATDAQTQPTEADDDSDVDSQAPAAASASHDAAAAHAAAHAAEANFADVLGAIQSPAAKSTAPNAPVVQQATTTAAPPEAQFAQTNHSTIISGIHGQLLPAGGTMQVRLDPPELGALSVIVRVHEGVMSASFETSNDQATRMLSHTLTQLKSSLEAQGVSVGKLHVTQSPKGQQSDWRNEDRPSQDNGGQDSAAQREQQRREMLRRMWRRLSGGQDPLDLVA